MSEELVYGGECPVCGDPFADGWEDFEEGDQITGAKICVIEKTDDGAEMADGIIHFPEQVSE